MNRKCKLQKCRNILLLKAIDEDNVEVVCHCIILRFLPLIQKRFSP